MILVWQASMSAKLLGNTNNKYYRTESTDEGNRVWTCERIVTFDKLYSSMAHEHIEETERAKYKCLVNFKLFQTLQTFLK